MGYTIFEPIGMRTDYPSVDLENKQVTARILYHDKVLMTVVVDLLTGTVQKEGSLEEVAHLRTKEGCRIVEEEREIDTIKSMAAFFLERGITNPSEYFKSL
jgi:hypothetical protein